MRILIVPDKFKGTLSAADAAEAIAVGWRRARSSDSLELVPMSDGGDGFGSVMSNLLEAEPRTVPTHDAAGRPRDSRWWWQSAAKTAVIETAQTIGLALLPPGKFHPFELDTSGLAKPIRAVIEARATRCFCGIGGSATNDGGFGLAKALGWQFIDRSGAPIERWTSLGSLAQIVPPRTAPWKKVDWFVAVDVANPLLGPTGASRIYGPQKGLATADMPRAEECLGRLAEVVKADLGFDLAKLSGTGAAGGLGFGLACFIGARLVSGFDLFAEHAKLAQRIHAADLVVTGEGSIDLSTQMGKGVGRIARLCREASVPCVGLAGVLGGPYRPGQGGEEFKELASIVPQWTGIHGSKRQPKEWLARVAADVAARFGSERTRKGTPRRGTPRRAGGAPLEETRPATRRNPPRQPRR